MSAGRRADAAVALAVAAIAALTLVPATAPGSQAPGILRLALPSLADILRNVALFVPLGAALAIRGLRPGSALALAGLLSATLEAAQLGIPGRYPSPWDVATNTLGAGLGILWVARVRRRATRDRGGLRVSRTWAWGAPVLALLATAWLAKPLLPDGRYYAHAPPRLAHFEPYTGRLEHAVLDGRPLGHGPLADTEAVRTALAGPFALALDLRKGSPPRELSALFLLTDERNREILLVGVEGEDVVVRYRDRAAALGLEPRLLRADDALAGVPARAPVHLRLHRGRDRFTLGIDGQPRRTLGPTLGRGWACVTPGWPLAAGLRAAIDTAWIALLWLGPGLAYRPRAASRLAVAVGVGLMLALPRLTFLMPTPPAQWLGAALGFGAGRLVRRGRAWAREAPPPSPPQPGASTTPPR